MDNNKLFIFEFADELDSFIKLNGKDQLKSAEKSILAIEACAQVKLKKIGLPFLNTVNFFGRKGHESAISASDKAITLLKKMVSIKDDIGITHGYNKAFIDLIRFFLHYNLFYLEVIDQIVNYLKPDILYTPPSNADHYILLFDMPIQKRYLGKLARQYCDSHNLKHSVLNIQLPIYSNGSAFLKKTMNFTRKLMFYSIFLKYSYLSKNRTLIIAPDQSYNMPELISRIGKNKKNILPVYLGSKNIRNDLLKNSDKKELNFFSLPTSGSLKRMISFKHTVLENLGKMKDIMAKEPAFFSFHGVDLRDQLAAYAQKAILPRLMDLYGRTIHLKKIILKNNHKVIMSQHSNEVSYNLGELCNNNNILGILVSHGSHTIPESKYAAIEMKELSTGLIDTHYPYLSIQTPYAEKYIEKNPIRSTTVRTGPLIFSHQKSPTINKEKLRNKVIPHIGKKKIILHAGTAKILNRASRFYIYETVDEYVDNINTLIQTVEKIPDCYIIVRFRPQRNFSEADLHTLLSPSACYSIHTEGDFEDYLFLSDLLFSYSSTTIEEALINRIPVLQYDPHDKYCHISKSQRLDPFSKPKLDSCYYVGSKEHLHWALKWILENHLFKEVPGSIWDRHVFKEHETTSLAHFLNQINAI